MQYHSATVHFSSLYQPVANHISKRKSIQNISLKSLRIFINSLPVSPELNYLLILTASNTNNFCACVCMCIYIFVYKRSSEHMYLHINTDKSFFFKAVCTILYTQQNLYISVLSKQRNRVIRQIELLCSARASWSKN